MDVSVLQSQLDAINVNRQTKQGILTVIDLKVNSEMKEVLMKIDSLEKRMDQRFELVDQRFEAMEQRFGQRFEVVDRRFDEMEQRFSTQFSMLKWMIGILAAMMSAMMTTMLLRG